MLRPATALTGLPTIRHEASASHAIALSTLRSQSRLDFQSTACRTAARLPDADLEPLDILGLSCDLQQSVQAVPDSLACSFGPAYPPSTQGSASETSRRVPGSAERCRRDPESMPRGPAAPIGGSSSTITCRLRPSIFLPASWPGSSAVLKL